MNKADYLKNKELLEEMTIERLTGELKDPNLDNELKSLCRKVLIEKQLCLIRKMHHTLILSSNLYVTDIKRVHDENKEVMWFLENEELIKLTTEQLGGLLLRKCENLH